MHLTLALLLSLGQTDAVAPQLIWPQWRGPTGDSVAPAANLKALPTTWSKTENVIWKTKVPGWGTSTPAIWKDAIFVTTQVDDERLLLLHIDRKKGDILWEREVTKGKPRRKGPVGENRFHDEHNMASPSPVTDGKHIWVHFGNGELACYDFAGERAWSLNLAKKHGPYTIWWGHANSPVLVGDLIISVCMQDPKDAGPSYIFALDKRTGAEKWFKKRDTGATEEPADSYTTPILHQNGKRAELIVFGGNVLDAYEPATGNKLWQCNIFAGNRVISGPTLAGDTVYAVQGMTGPLFAVKAGGDGDITKTHVRWKFAGQTPDAASPVVANGLVFLATNPGIAVCIDAENGKEVWKQRLADAFRATPLVAGERIYFFGKEGKTTLVTAGRKFEVVGESELEEVLMASPAVAQGDLFLRTKGHLYRIGAAKKAP